ncbi:MAG: peptidylprolyl isomerase [Methylococcaceae bacterium]|nr:peptidylprolyl isomerase [Methylococcaceae bacterium]MCI0668171.1 peptidylprolyl isomerase [Methylococcaceae bacterium]MCI0732673.1 peptidylprolyl isomerase [Methylococcaceae bacterium]
MVKNLLAVIAVIPVLFLTACNPSDSTQPAGTNAESAAAPEEGEVVAMVNGQPITEQTLNMISEANRSANIPREKLIDDLIKHELLYQEAVRKNLETNEDVAQRIRFIQRSILSQAAMQDFIANTPISDAEIQKEYQQTFGSPGQEEFKARHILTETEEKAKEIIQKLKAGGKFEELAKEYSTGPVGPKGGDLGWFSAQQMVAPFSEAVVALKNGEYTQQPVHTQFGWHVILREDSRAKTPPPLDSMKANIQAQLQRKAIENHLESLRANAKIEIIPPKPAEPVIPPAAVPAPPASPSPESGRTNEQSSAAEEKPSEPPSLQEAAGGVDKSATPENQAPATSPKESQPATE